MKNALALIALVLPACASPPPAVDPGFYGRWKNVETRIHRSDGSVTAQTDIQCVSEVTPERMTSECTLPDGRKGVVVARIESLTPTSYELVVVDSPSPQAVGARSRVDYRIDGNRRISTVYPEPRAGTSSPRVVKVETIYVRE